MSTLDSSTPAFNPLLQSTLDHDSSLPALPLPELRDTRAFAEELIVPLVDEKTLAATRAALDELARPDGAGEILHRELAAMQAELPGNASWLRPFWDDMYLAWREPLPINMNYILCLDAERWGGASALPRFLHCLAWLLSQTGVSSLPPEATRSGFLSMDQTQTCVHTRIPGPACDSLRPVSLNGPQQLAVTRNGHWFILQICASGGALLPETEIAAALDDIKNQADALQRGPAVSAFTSAERGAACALRAELQNNEQNRLNLAAVENAILVLCLDDAPGSPASHNSHDSDADLCRRILCGDAGSRWYDKSLQIIATDNHGLGINFEHSGCDAGIWLYLLTRADEILAVSETGRPSTLSAEGKNGSGPAWRRLHWVVPKETSARLEEMREKFAAWAGQIDLQCVVFPEFSREAAKKLGSSPDAFLQLSFQAAQHAIFGKLRSTYEAVAMRAFYQGRTEAGRSSTAEALAFAQALHAENSPDETLLALYRQAERAHSERLARCQKGLGAERHLYALQHIWAMRGARLGIEEPPAIFSDPGWLTLKHNALSTSGIGAPFIRYFGFGPVVGDGLGIGYAPNGDFTSLMVTAFKNSSPEAGSFVSEFRQAAGAIAEILRG